MTAADVIAMALICDWQTADEDSREYGDEMAAAILAALRGAGFAVVPLGGETDALGYLRWTVTACRRCGYERPDCHCTTGFAAPQVAAAEPRTGGE